MGFVGRLRDRLFARPGRDQNTEPLPDPSRPESRTPPPLKPPAASPGLPRFSVLDIETSDLSPAKGRIIEVAIVTTDPLGQVLDEWSTKINPQGPVGRTDIHGIRPQDVVNAPVFHDAIAELTSRLAGTALVAHNARFELSFLRAEYLRAGWVLPEVPHLCTLEASLIHLPQLGRRRLADCCWAVGTPLTDAHTALGDARATAVVLAAFMHPNWGPPPPPHHACLPMEALAVRWPSGPVQDPEPPSVAAPEGFRWAVPTPAAPALVSVIDRLSLAEMLEEGAPAATVGYLEKLAEALEDGELSEQEGDNLMAFAEASGLAEEDVHTAHKAFVQSLAHAAMDDGSVSRAERSEMITIAAMLKVDPKIVPALLDRAEIARELKLGDSLPPLPVDWAHGTPLRIGDRIAFTGCEAHNRPALEARATSLGLRVANSVSGKTALLVSDGTVSGTKAAEAEFLGTRVVHPDELKILLDHLQPALPRQPKPLPKTRRPRAPKVQKATAESGSSEPGVVTVDQSRSNQAPGASPSAGLGGTPAGTSPAQVRQWGRDNGWEVGTRGRLNPKLVAAYIAANDQAELST